MSSFCCVMIVSLLLFLFCVIDPAQIELIRSFKSDVEMMNYKSEHCSQLLDALLCLFLLIFTVA